MRGLFVCTGHRKDALCFLALTRRVAGTGAASPGDSARAGTLPCAGVAGRHALPRECRGARPFCGFSPPVVYQGGGRVWGGSSSSDHAQSCGRWRLCRVPEIPGGKAAQGVQGPPGRRRNEPGCLRQNRGPGTGHADYTIPRVVYLCALSKTGRVRKAKTDVKQAEKIELNRTRKEIVKQIKQEDGLNCDQEN